jgi:hypothetical protein
MVQPVIKPQKLLSHGKRMAEVSVANGIPAQARNNHGQSRPNPIHWLKQTTNFYTLGFLFFHLHLQYIPWTCINFLLR